MSLGSFPPGLAAVVCLFLFEPTGQGFKGWLTDCEWAKRYEVNPYGVVSLADQNFGAYQDYDISVTLNLPRSPTNLDRGNFMLALHLLDDKPPAGPSKIMPWAATPGATLGPTSLLDGRNILHVSTRPAIVPYTDPLVSLASRLLFLAYHVFVPASETTKLVVPMVERLEFQPGRMNPTQLVLDVQAGQTLQVYSVAITITAQLRGLRWFMHTWWMTSFVVFTVLFWLCEIFFLGVGYLSVKVLFGGSGPSNKESEVKREGSQQQQHPAIKQEGEDRGKNLEDVPMTFPTSSGQLPLRYDPPDPAHTNGLEGDEPQADLPPAPGGEADDEYEDAGAQEYEALGELDEARDSGLGTSFSERDTVSLRRRTSRGRMGGANS